MPKYYIAKVVGLGEDFVHDPNEPINHSVYKAGKEDYGDFIFTRTLRGYKEVITGRKFDFQYTGRTDDGWQTYYAPKNTGLFVDKNTAREIPKSVLQQQLNAYAGKFNEQQLTNFFDEAQAICDANLTAGIIGEEQTTMGPRR